MPLTLAQLVQPLTFAQSQQLLLSALQGLGPVIPSNGTSYGTAAGTGSATLSGTPSIPSGLTSPLSCIAQISTSGEPGTAQVQISTDGGATYAAAVSIPSNGQVAVTGTQGSTGATITFAAGPTGAGTSFISGDQYSFQLATPNFPTNAWQALSVPRSLIGAESQAIQSFSTLQATLAASGFAGINPATGLPYASGPWMDLVSQNVYNNTRNQAVATVGQMTLADSAGQGPFVITAGQLLVANANGSQLYSNTNGGTLTKNGTLNLNWQCTQPGSAGNLANSSSLVLATSLPGVTVTNPAVFSGNTTWISTSGTDAESDTALSVRDTGKWSTLVIGATAATYNTWALTADATITRTLVQLDGTVAGQADVICAGNSGGSSGGAVTNAQNYINARLPLGFAALVSAASNVAITLTGTVYFFAAKTTSALATTAVVAALTSFFNSFGIGKDSIPSIVVYLNEIIGVIEGALGPAGTASAGIRNCVLSSPVGDTGLILGQCVSWANVTNNLVFTGV